MIPDQLAEGSSGLLGLFISAFISSTIAPGGSEAVLAYLVNAGKHPIFELLVTASIGNTLGATTTWYLGHLAAKRWPADDPADAKRHKAIQTLQRYGYSALLFSWLPVIGDALCFGAGWLKLSFFFSTMMIGIGKLVRYAIVALLTLHLL
jgi:membrane protein YqaA with SNARE-associated domain